MSHPKDAQLPRSVDDRPELAPVPHPEWCVRERCQVRWMMSRDDAGQPLGNVLDGAHYAAEGTVRVELANGVGSPEKGRTSITVCLSQSGDEAPVVDLMLDVPEPYDDGAVQIGAPVEVDALIDALAAVTAPLRKAVQDEEVRVPQHNRVIRADVAEPLYDSWKGMFILPGGYSDAEAAQAMLELVRERSPR